MIRREETENIALLSKLYVAEDEIEDVAAQLSCMMDFADTVALAQIDEVFSEETENLSLREDVVGESLPVCDVLMNTESAGDKFFIVKKVNDYGEN